MFIHFFSSIVYVLKLVIPGWIIFRVGKILYLKHTNIPVEMKKELLLFLLVVYVGSLIAVTIAPASILGFNDPNAIRLNWMPVINTIAYYLNALQNHDDDAAHHALENIIGNLILLIPLGILLPCLFKAVNSSKKILIICMVCSISIELIQFVLRQFGTFRTVDIDDLILNTIGGMLGWLIYSKTIQHFCNGRKPVTT